MQPCWLPAVDADLRPEPRQMQAWAVWAAVAAVEVVRARMNERPWAVNPPVTRRSIGTASENFPDGGVSAQFLECRHGVVFEFMA